MDVAEVTEMLCLRLVFVKKSYGMYLKLGQNIE